MADALALTRWAIITGEYPPQPGGVADYTRLVARGLRATGDDVSVYTSSGVAETADDGFAVHRLPGHFGLPALLRLNSAIHAFAPDRILVQYVPHAFGWKAMNLPFVWSMSAAAKKVAPLWVMFHEVMFPLEAWRPFRHRLLGRANLKMARTLANAAQRIFATIPAWQAMITEIAPKSCPARWLPVPSNLPTEVNDAAVERVKTDLLTSSLPIVGHFGTFNSFYAHLLEPSLRRLLEADHYFVALVGRGAEAFRARLIADNPAWSRRTASRDGLTAAATAAHIAACDVMLQPYHDGVSCRRTTMMAALSLGRPIVSNIGVNTDPIWSSAPSGVQLVSTLDPAQIAAAVVAELRLPPELRQRHGELNRVWYDAHFALHCTIERLRAED